MTQESQKSNTVLIIIATIGVLGTILASAIGAIGNYNIEKLRQETELTQTALNALTPTIAPSLTSSQITLAPSTVTPVPQNVGTQVAIMQTQVAALEYAVTQQVTNHNYDSEMAILENKLKSLDSDLSVIEQAVLDNPKKSLELTFMRNEIDDIKEKNKLDAEQTNKLIDRIYAQNNWFIGLIFTITLSLVGLVVSNFAKKPAQADERKKESSKSKN